MTFAQSDDLKIIYSTFHTRLDIFPHIRQDALKRRIEAHQCVWQDGVAITFQQYRKRTQVGTVAIPAKSIMLHQIINSNQFSGAGGRMFEAFFEEIVIPSGGDLYLSVRTANVVACDFYEKHGMECVGTVVWSGGTLPGKIYLRCV